MTDYDCIYCKRFIKADEYGIYVHDNVYHNKNDPFSAQDESQKGSQHVYPVYHVQ